ncbi:nuclear transport factor 2 family protein [Asticcacaulis machinosus]|uniref:Nuclear transport factor 2 family protein n=1 Tax=Asticcacaulis machinosus TaxID=2984211 RepID=A0ABT5HHE7_9CAUL|nr:nuclear transport factor 2 family protein [Asticcacaulis machinosus]MDC7675536.1 nuclear transport factor 2 family protein [Asticcacaulis machinosus]
MKLTITIFRLAVMAFVVAGAPMSAQAGGSPMEQRNEKVVRDAFETWATEGGNVFKILAPDVKWTIPGSGPVAGTYHGIDDFMARASVPLVQRLAGPLKPKVHHIWAVDDRVIIRFDGSAMTTSGATYTNQFVWIFKMDDGQVVEAEAFLDLIAYQTVVDNNPVRAQ